MARPTTNRARNQRRSTLWWLALDSGLLVLFAAVVAGYFLWVKPSLLFTRTVRGAAYYQNSYYGSRTQLLESPRAVALDDDGTLFVADATRGRIVVFDHYGQRQRSFGAGTLQSPCALAVAGNRLYVIDAAARSLYIYTTDGTLRKTVAFIDGTPTAVAVRPASGLRAGELYVAFETGIARGSLDGSFSEVYLAAGTAVGKFRGIAGLAVAEGAGEQPVVYCADLLNQRVTALTSLATSPTVLWTSDAAAAPSGIAADAEHVYVADGLGNRLLSLDAQRGTRDAVLATPGSRDGFLRYPSGITLRGSLLYVADRGNHRVASYATTPHAHASKMTLTPVSRALAVAPAVLFALLSLLCLGLRARVREQRYLVAPDVAETSAETTFASDLASMVTHVYVPERVEEYIRDLVIGTDLVVTDVRPSRRGRREVAALAEEVRNPLDPLDEETLAALVPHRHDTALITGMPALQAAGEALGCVVVAPGWVSEQAVALDEAARAAAAEEAAPSDEEGGIRVGLLVVCGLLACVLAGAVPVAAHAATRTTVRLSALRPPTGVVRTKTVSIAATTTVRFTAADHDTLRSNCLSCHDADTASPTTTLLDGAATEDCVFCHTGSGVAVAAQVYRASGGRVDDLGDRNSGHELGLRTAVPDASESGLYELTCYSCHKRHGGVALKSNCTSCHDRAGFSAKKTTAAAPRDGFTLTRSVAAHAQSDAAVNGAAAHGRAGLTCYSCHRGGLTAASGKGCDACHYRSDSFADDPLRTAHTADWPHSSRNDADLLGNWTVVGQGARIGKVITPDLGSINLANETEAACGRCHPTADGTNFAASLHTLQHDAVRAKRVAFLHAVNPTSALMKLSPGFVASGENRKAAPFAGEFEFGPGTGSYENIACADCHYSDVQTEHALRAPKGCNSCHTAKGGTTRDWTKVRSGMKIAQFSSCGVGETACHKKDWHGTHPQRFTAAHAVSHGGKTHRSSCAGGDPRQRTCHGSASVQSLFRFGAMDIASAHNDYWSAQKIEYNTNTLYTKTIVNLTEVRGCALCHSKTSTTIYGAARKRAGTLDCSSCHTKKSKVYAKDSCYAAPRLKRATQKKPAVVSAAERTAREAQAYVRTLATQQTAATGGSTVAGAGSGLAVGISAKARQQIPGELLPVTKPPALNSFLSIIRTYLAPYPSIMNRATPTYENV